MHPHVKFILFVTLSYGTTGLSKPTRSSQRPYCDVTEGVSLIRFNFASHATTSNDHVVEDEKTKEKIRLSLCSPLKEPCNGKNNYIACLTGNGTEKGIGKGVPDPVLLESGKMAFKFEGDICKDQKKYSTYVIMKCNNEIGYNTSPQMFPHQADDCNYYFAWETRAACGLEHPTKCIATDTMNNNYDLTPLMLRSDNYVIPINNKSAIILNVCHSVVYDYDVRCPEGSGSCLREVDSDKKNLYKNLGNVQNSPYFDKNNLVLKYEMGDMCTLKNINATHISTTITFVCDQQAMNTLPEYVGGSDECHYRFTWRTITACSIESLQNHNIALSTVGTCKVTNPITNVEYNLSHLMSRDYSATTTQGMEYVFRVCGSVSDESCPFGTGACIAKQGKSVGLSNNNLMWSEGGPFLNYTDGAECGHNQRHYTQIAFFCGAAGTVSAPMVMENEDCSLIIHWSTSLVCDKKISCETTNSEIDLASLIRWSENYVVRANDTEFHINVCRPLVPRPYLTCLPGSAACQAVPVANGQFINETSLGFSDNNPFFDADKNVILRYTGGSACPENKNTTISTNFTFLCDNTVALGAPRYKSYQNCTYSFEWKSSKVCKTAEGHWMAGCTIVNPHLSHKVNLTALQGSTVYNIKGQSGHQYNIRICGGDSFCQGSAVCKDDTNYGTPSTVIFNYSQNVINLQYSNGSRCKTGDLSSSEVQLICDQSSGTGVPMLKSEGVCNVVFEWKTNVVCPNNTNTPVLIDNESKIEPEAKTIEEAATNHVGAVVGILILVCCLTLIIYLIWTSKRRPSLRSYLNSIISTQKHCRAKYTKVDTTEKARLLLDVADRTQSATNSDSDEELVDA